MKISTKILWATLPLLVLAFVLAAGITYILSRSALSDVAEQWLSTKSAEALQVAEDQVEFLEAYSLSTIEASVMQAKLDTLELLSEMDLGEGGLILVSNLDGELQIVEGVTETSISNQTGSLELEPDGHGKTQIKLGETVYQASYLYFKPWSWFVFAAAPEAEVYGAVNRLGWWVLVLGLVGSGTIGVILYMLTGRITAPLAQLVSGVERVGQGELDTRIDVKSTDEVGTLSASFNAMTDELQSLYARLEQRFSTIISQTPIIVFSTDEDGNIKLVEGKGLSASGMTPEHLVGQNLKDLLGVSFAPEFDKNREFKSIIDIGDQVFDVWCAPASTNKGTSEGLIGVATNVTQQARAQEKLERQARDLSVLNGQVTEKNDMLESLSSKLSKYLSPQVYSSIFSGAQNVEISAQRKKLTVFFSDLAGFTETTEKLESEELTELLNKYLTEMSDIAFRHGATIDKYVGDAIVIFFGDPETRGEKEDALACVRMAVEMQERMEALGVEWRDKGVEHPLRCRIGINTGYCTVGNFGSKDRMDYTIIGGGVNLASRLEGLASPGDILVSFETHAYVKDQIFCEEFGQHEVKGISYPVTSFRVAKNEEKELASSLSAMGVNLPDGVSCYSESEKSELATHLEAFLVKLRSES